MNHLNLNSNSSAFQCQWYWGNISVKKVERILKDRPPGTFILRDSRSDHYFFSISYQTAEGIFHTHVSLHNGRYCLGGPKSLIQSRSLVKFVEKTIRLSKDQSNYHILMHPNPSRTEERRSDVYMQYPLNRCALLPPLKHLCRIVIRHSIRSESDIIKLPIPTALQRYLKSSHYLYSV